MSITDQIKNIPESEKTPLVIILLEIIQQQAEEIQHLKDEIARLKSQKPKPKIKPSNLVKETDKPGKNKEKRKRGKMAKTKNIKIMVVRLPSHYFLKSLVKSMLIYLQVSSIIC